MHGKTIEIRFSSLISMFYNFSAISLRVDFIGSEEEVFSGGKSFIFPADIVVLLIDFKMPLTLYSDRRSPMVRAVLLFMKANNVEFEEVGIDLMKGEQYTNKNMPSQVRSYR